MTSAASGCRILVVEDDPVVGALFRELLPRQGHEVELAVNGEEARVRFDAESFDLVITDKNLPGISGLELLKDLKALRPDVDVILMTAYADFDSVVTAVGAGVYDYLVKPFDSLEEVVGKIGRALEKRRILLENRRLLESLTQANQQIEAMNKNLEQQVLERTRQLVDANNRLEQLSITDDVTGLYNQRFLFGRLEEEFRRAGRHHEELVVVMIDIDRFKLVNDGHDHLFGSRVLKRFGAVLQCGVRNVDFAVRYGGDEFALLLPHTRLQDAIFVAERLRTKVAKSDLGDEGSPCIITLSAGVAGVGTSGADSGRALLGAADRALYFAKANGRNQVAVLRDGAAVPLVAL